MSRVRRSILLTVLCLAVIDEPAHAEPAIRIVRRSSAGTQLLRNSDFEDLAAVVARGWVGWHQGYELATSEGRNGSSAVACERAEGQGEFGAGQTVYLNRTNVAPLVIRGWSKARDVSGSPDSGYSLYADIVYTDGSPLWGRTADFDCGTHDWQQREFVLLPDKPVKSITLHCLFRGHTGKAWFDDVSLEEIPTPAGAVLFQGVPVLPPVAANPVKLKPQSFSTRDGFKLALAGTGVTSMQVNGRDVGSPSPSGFLARDFGANSDIYSFSNGACPELGLVLKTDVSAWSNHIAVEGSVADTRGRDRAITLLFALPLDAAGWIWGDDVRHQRTISGNAEFINARSFHCGADGKMSLYPLAAIWNKTAGLALALDMDRPAQYRLVCHPGTRQFFIAYDFGLAPDTAKSPSSASFRFVLYQFDPRWGFRAALQKYYDIFPSQFTRRVAREGVWMPFTDIATIPGYGDFGFAFQEGAPNVPFDDQHDIASFVYVEPMSHWLPLPKEVPRTYAAAMAVITNDLGGARSQELRRMAAATLSSGIRRGDGTFALHLVDAPWCDGGVFTLNPDPGLPVTPEWPATKASVMFESIESAFKKNQRPPGALNPHAGLDGVYLDSLEMSSGELNYRRDHFRSASVPLVFDTDGHVCQMQIFETWEFAREIAGRMHSRGKLTFANGALWNFSFPAPLLDVLGTEINWLHNSRYEPDTDQTMNFRRALCRQKPYCLLMNTDYSQFTPDLVERYFQRCLFYGVWPGFFDEDAASKDPYWGQRSKWYERDRELFRRYIPLLRQITTAGWQPITSATVDNAAILVERYGPDSAGRIYFACLNDSPDPQHGILTLDLKSLHLRSAELPATELLSDAPATLAQSSCALELASQQLKILRLETRRPVR